MRVLVDTSVWSLALRRRNPKITPETEALSDLISEGRVAIIGAIRQELLSGVRYPEQFDRLCSALTPFPDESVDTADYVEAAKISNKCLRSGILTGNTDSLICAIAIDRGMEVLTTDKDFVHMAGVVPVKLH